MFLSTPTPRNRAPLRSQEYGYPDRIGEMMGKSLSRVLVSLDDLRDFEPELCANLMARPFNHIPALETALREVRIARRRPTPPRCRRRRRRRHVTIHPASVSAVLFRLA